MSPGIPSCGNRGASGRKHLRVLLPFTCNSLVRVALSPVGGRDSAPTENHPILHFAAHPRRARRGNRRRGGLRRRPIRRKGQAPARRGRLGRRRRVPRARVAGIRGRVRRRRGVVLGPPAPRRRLAHRQGVRLLLLPQRARNPIPCR